MCHHPDKFGSQRHCVSGDVIFLIYHIVLQDHLIKGSSDFMARSLLKEVITMPSLVAVDIAVVSMSCDFLRPHSSFMLLYGQGMLIFFLFFLRMRIPCP